MTSANTQIISYSPSSSKSTHQFSFDVFLSFRGEDTRYGFTDHLYEALISHGILTFRDDEELERGVIASELLKVIEESKIFVIILSENYATSRWCLDELVKISEYIAAEQRLILPIFYHVDPSEVRKQEGSYKKAFDDHEEGADEEKREKIKKWRTALTKVGYLAGYELKKDRFEAKFIQKIREEIISKLNRKSLSVGENIVGMDFHLKRLKSLIEIESDEVNIVGIYGIAGIGKTTIAMAIYNDISNLFYGSSFLKDVGAKSEYDLVGLQKTLLQDILQCETPEFQSTKGIVMIQEKLRWKRVLIVVDDVDNYTQLKNLVGNYGWYGAGSLIIITTRNLHLLVQLGVEKRYEVNILDPEESIKLFCLWAFKQNTPKPNFESLSKSIVKCAGGLPIALEAYGCMLFGCTEDEWQSALDQLKKRPHEKVQRTLKVSYDKLDEMEQKMFLDIACFFRGEDKDFVSRIFGSYADIVIKSLHNSCLITISENKLDMHDLLQQMGREIVRQECVKEPGKRSRLWDPNDVESVLTRNTGTKKIEGLFVEIFRSSWIQFSTNSFTKLNNLRLLKVYYQTSFWHTPLSQNVEKQLPVDFEFPSFALRYLHFEKYPLESLPTKFDGRNLVELNLKHSSIKQLWNDNETLNNLKVINLSYSEHLIKIPKLSSVPNLEILILTGCRSLVSLPEIKGNMSKLREIDLSETAIEELQSSIGHLKALKHLNLQYCVELVSLPESIWNLSSLETLEVRDCLKLERLEVTLKAFSPMCLILKGGIWWRNDCFSSLKTLNLPHNKMEGEVLNHHVFPLSSLVELCIKKSEGMERQILSDGSHLSSLKVSSFGNFNPMARGILSDIFHQSSLETLSLHNCNLMEEGIRGDIWNLSSLVKLSLTNCNLMEGEILNHVCHLSSLERLSLEGNHFSSIPASISQLSHLRGLNLSHCNKLQEIPELPYRLRFLDVHCSEGILSSPSLLSIPSLLNCFNSELIEESDIDVGSSWFVGKGMSIVIPRSSGIVEGIRNQGMGSHRVTIELPQNWFENNDLLGFAVCCFYVHEMDGNVPVCGDELDDVDNDDEMDDADSDDELDETDGNVPVRDDELDETEGNVLVLDDESHEFDFLDDEWDESDFPPLDIYCKLSIRGTYLSKYMDKLSFHCRHCCNEHNDDSVSDQVWVIYYPKDAIKEEYRSNQWTHLMASFHDRRTLKVIECGIHPIYMPNTHVRSSFGTDHWPQLLRENTGFNVKRSRDDAEDHPTEDPHPNRSRHLQFFDSTQFSSPSCETQKSIEDLAMASTSTQMVSYSSTSNPRWSHDVFLSFRGTDTRYNFTEHLYKALVQRGINTFRDGELRRGGEIAVELLKTIEESRSSIVVLSETYADSRWCLDELAKIMECRRESRLLVFPIFYHVDPSDVRKQSGRFGEAFAKYEENWKDEVQRWRAALTEAANLSGWHVLHGYDSKLVKEIIGRIVKRLNPKLLPVEEHIVGMDFRLKELKSLLKVHLDDIRIVGIYGRSGIGKTATAKMVYNQILCDFNGGCFLEDVKSRSKCINGRLQLLQELLHGILGVNVELNNINDGIDMIKGRLCSKRVFVVIDDVDDSNQVKLLVKSCKWFGLGSRIILTTRDKRLLKVYGVDESYEAKGLCNEEAIHLFSCHAFKQNTPKEDYVDMSNPMVNYAQGLPLAIKVLGSFLHGKPIDEWKSTLDKLTEEDQEIYNVLKICYDGLDDNEKEILLDIACFFKGQDKDFALRILNSCNFFAEIGVRILCDQCFISISNNMIGYNKCVGKLFVENLIKPLTNGPDWGIPMIFAVHFWEKREAKILKSYHVICPDPKKYNAIQKF